MRSEPGGLVVMARPLLDDVRQRRLPTGYRLRAFAEGDQEEWRRIQVAADAYSGAATGLFHDEFGARYDALARRQLYVEDTAENAIGTVTAWFPEDGVISTFGRLHWLAVVPSAQRRGLGGALVAAALVRLGELGYGRAYLTTGAARHGALRLYTSFGFSEVAPREIRVDP